MTVWLTYLVTGAAAGLAAGLLGVGGGLIIVPVLVFAFLQQGMHADVVVHMAVGTSLATIIFTSISSVSAHHKRGAVLWPLVWQLSPGIVVGSLLGALIAKQMSSDNLRIFFGIFELLVAIQMALQVKPKPHRPLPGRLTMAFAGGIIGSVSAIVGIGGGTMTVPFLVWSQVAMKNAVATSSACGLPIAVAGAVGFVLTGWQDVHLPEYSSGYIYWPAFIAIVIASVSLAPLGARLAHHLPALVLKRLFAILLAGLGLRMLFSA